MSLLVYTDRPVYGIWEKDNEMANLAKSKPTDEKMNSSWPPGLRRVTSLFLVFHLASVIAAALGDRPCSPLEEAAKAKFLHYYELIDQGYGHRYYSDIGPTPIVTAELRFADGRANRTIRLPDRSMRPRMRYQRHLALAHWLSVDVRDAERVTGHADESLRAKAYARHLCLTHPGCSGVTLRLQQHEIPDIERLLAEARAGTLNVDADEFYKDLGPIGDFPCPQ